MNCDQMDMGNKTASRVRNKGMAKMDQVRALELAIVDYKKDANDKNWSNIDKILQVRPMYISQKASDYPALFQ